MREHFIPTVLALSAAACSGNTPDHQFPTTVEIATSVEDKNSTDKNDEKTCFRLVEEKFKNRKPCDKVQQMCDSIKGKSEYIQNVVSCRQTIIFGPLVAAYSCPDGEKRVDCLNSEKRKIYHTVQNLQCPEAWDQPGRNENQRWEDIKHLKENGVNPKDIHDVRQYNTCVDTLDRCEESEKRLLIAECLAEKNGYVIPYVFE